MRLPILVITAGNDSDTAIEAMNLGAFDFLCKPLDFTRVRDLGKAVDALSPEAEAVLLHYGWPGNVRELQSVLRQSLLQARGSVLLADFLPPAVRARPWAAAGAVSAQGASRR